jgi:hypothetical protein
MAKSVYAQDGFGYARNFKRTSKFISMAVGALDPHRQRGAAHPPCTPQSGTHHVALRRGFLVHEMKSKSITRMLLVAGMMALLLASSVAGLAVGQAVGLKNQD